jgi:DNA-directed RNA polymerase subunit alpha
MSAQDLQLPRLIPLKVQGTHGTYAIDPLEPGYGATVSTMLRRTLLSHLPGVAISSLHIKGASDKAKKLPGVKESVTELVLNVKQLRLRSLRGEQREQLHLDVQGPRLVTAADLVLPEGIEVLTPGVHLASVTGTDAPLVLDLEATHGKGYVPAELHRDVPVGFLPVDSIYTPIRKVETTIEHTRLGQRTDYDRVVLDLWTDGTRDPEEAIIEAAALLVQQLLVLSRSVHEEPLSQRAGVPPGSLVEIPQHLSVQPIEVLELGVRTLNSLKRHGLTTLGLVLEQDEEDLRALRNFGDKSLVELTQRLRAYQAFPR